MNAPVRLSLYGLVLALVFAVAGFAANAIIPQETVDNWSQEMPGHGDHEDSVGQGDHGSQEERDHDNSEDGDDSYQDASPLGLSVAQDGYRLNEVSAPSEVAARGDLSYVVTGPEGEPVVDFDLSHDEEMHLIVVRADGQHFRHVHPTLESEGVWSIPWEWDNAGTYRIFTDFVPSEVGEGITLSTSAQVAGDYSPEAAELTETATVDDFEVTIEGELVAEESTELTLSISRDGEPVTQLEPYLGAFGHLVVLRESDLAYLHAHPHGEEPEAGDTSGPDIQFEVSAPTEGRYFIYLDFQVDGEVFTAELVADAAETAETAETADQANGEQGSGNGSDSNLDTEHDEGDDHDHG